MTNTALSPDPDPLADLRARAEQVLADYGHPHWWNDRRHGPWSSTAEAINASAEASELLRAASVALTGDPDALHETLAPGIDYAEAAWLVVCRPDAVAAWIDAARLAERIEELEAHIASGEFVVMTFSEPVPRGDTGGAPQAGRSGRFLPGDRHPSMSARPGRSREAVASSPRVPPPVPVRAPYLRRELAYRRRGAWLEWQRPSAWRRWLAAAAWLFIAVHLAVWAVR